MKFNEEYQSRINKVADFIDQNLDRKLTLREFAEVSGISIFHFHRLFLMYTGEPIAGYIRRKRLSIGMKEIAHGSDRSVLDIAIALGYENSSAFIRAFKKRFGISPKNESRQNASSLTLWKSQKSDSKLQTISPIRIEQRSHLNILGTAVKGKEARSFEKAAQNCFKKVISELNERKLMNQVGRAVAVYFEDPDLSALDSMTYFGGFEWFYEQPNNSKLELMQLNANNWAVFEHHGSYNTIWQTWNSAYRNWLPLSGYDLGDNYPFELYINDPRTVKKESELKTEIYIPLKERIL